MSDECWVVVIECDVGDMRWMSDVDCRVLSLFKVGDSWFVIIFLIVSWCVEICDYVGKLIRYGRSFEGVLKRDWRLYKSILLRWKCWFVVIILMRFGVWVVER